MTATKSRPMKVVTTGDLRDSDLADLVRLITAIESEIDRRLT